WQQYTNSPFSF
nr:immunoglobulin light chain junction region [Macaca mulatta]